MSVLYNAENNLALATGVMKAATALNQAVGEAIAGGLRVDLAIAGVTLTTPTTSMAMLIPSVQAEVLVRIAP